MVAGTDYGLDCYIIFFLESDCPSMSYILDALKKIELEKSRKSRADGRVNISGELYNERKRPTAQRPALKSVVAIALVVFVASGSTWYLVKKKSKGNTTFSQMPVPPSPVNSPMPVGTPAVPQSPPQAALPVILPPASNVEAPPRPSAQPPVPPAHTLKRPREAVSRVSVPQPHLPAPPKSIVKKTPVPTVQPPAEIKLSGIAWQDDHGLRRAVINGFLLKEGGTIMGSTISEIQYDRVKFTTPEGRFELRLDSIVPAEVKK